MKQLFIIHGYQASTNSHWFQWLADKMAKYSYKTQIVYLPNSKNPDFKQWEQALKDNLDNKLNSQTIIVAHSLGVITTLNYLSKLNQMPKIKGLFLVSGFIQTLNNIPELDNYIQQCKVTPENIQASHIYSIAANQDPVVNIKSSEQLSNAFNIDTYTIQHNGHFLGNEGYETFSELYNLISKTL
ncbi:RBBP9/YdeN family alpha/beta hydrolase [Staphylococcus gallinarum]|uniref:RBBP9/YdeN family alpha/beta hydrolase n=1 Tax=Staphylococcus gallinarum TaxID=1293 RepID=UPI001E3C909B|nr:alpha/beta hydrolase [Staphylococcus gallinarum]MCD8919467.1 alpha/beta hydrolase [Staphylococcus gallinarum]MEB6276942.1 alpha/beta hydrolase [Staphylococcus gallinarum]UEH01650.1 alpha/beta hydrolase [Staphylococcus gallinarum]